LVDGIFIRIRNNNSGRSGLSFHLSVYYLSAEIDELIPAFFEGLSAIPDGF
jgi:hypothetical protein